MPIDVGAVVCVHYVDPDDGRRADESWIGVVCGVVGNGNIFRVKQLGFRQKTSFTFKDDELCETIVTFEGPMCVECGRPR